MNKITKILENVDENNQEKVDWTKAWSEKYSILKEYQKEVDIEYYADKIEALLLKLQSDYGYSKQDAMLVLKDILYHKYLDK